MTKYYVFNKTKYPFKDNVTKEQATKWYIMSKQKNPEMGEEKNIYNNTLGTLTKSGTQFAKDMAQPIIHPIETAKSLFGLGSSLVNLFRKGEQGNEDIARAVGAYFAERYGGIENIKKTFRTDPVGFAADLSIILTGGATLVPKVAQTSGKVGAIVQKAVNAVKQTGQFIDPLNIPLKTAGVVKNYAVKPILGAAADLVGGNPTIPFLTKSNTGLAYQAGKTGGDMQEAYQAGKGNIIESSPLGRVADKVFDLKIATRNASDKSGFVNTIINDLEKLKKTNLNDWKASKDRLNLKNVKVSKAEITKILKNAEKNGKFKGVWVNKADEKIFKTITSMKDEVFSATQRRNGIGADLLVTRLNDLLKNNKQSKLIEEIRDNVKSNINSKSPDYNDLTLAQTEISKIENIADNILKDKSPDVVLKNVRNIIKNNKAEKALLNDLNPSMGKNLDAFEAGAGMSSQNLATTIGKHAVASVLPFPAIGSILAGASNPRVISGLANTLGKGRRAITPNQKIQTGLGTSARLARALQQKEDDTVFYGS